MLPALYIQYHNADDHENGENYPNTDIKINTEIHSINNSDSITNDKWIRASIVKKKSIEDAIGSFCFLLLGKKQSNGLKLFYLFSFFKIEDYKEKDDHDYNLIGHGFNISNPILLNNIEGFRNFQSKCANFITFRNIEKLPFSAVLFSLVKEKYSLKVAKNEIFDEIFIGKLSSTIYKDYGQAPNDNPEELQTFARKIRRGQKKFRDTLIEAYQCKCCLCESEVETVLDACHIVSHAVSGENSTENGLLLRTDIHAIFDDGLLAIHPDNLVVFIHPQLKNSEYWQYNGRTIINRNDGKRPSRQFLSERWKLKNW